MVEATLENDAATLEGGAGAPKGVAAFEANFKKVRERAHADVVLRRRNERESWDAWWKVTEIESRGNPIKRLRYFAWLAFDYPVSWVREKVVEPLHDKFRWPHYHRKFNRVPDVDECPVGDHVCLYEANWQFRLDKMVDTNILFILRQRTERCFDYHYDQYRNCNDVMNELEENELNYYIKYGEMGFLTDAVDCYMKQKHRMIWERRHPKLMQMRAKAYEEHKAKLEQGIYDEWFWKRGTFPSFKQYGTGYYRHANQRPAASNTRDDESQDPARLKEEAEIRARGELVNPIDEYKFWEVFP